MTIRPILDPCCGSRMFWFDRQDGRAVFGDIRQEAHSLQDRSSPGGSRQLVIAPDVLLDFRALPYGDASFHLVVFDPPHLVQNGRSGWLGKVTFSVLACMSCSISSLSKPRCHSSTWSFTALASSPAGTLTCP